MRVLVVDDYRDNVESMALLLRLYGHEVETALGGAAALQAANANQPDLVFLDISMPGMDGYEVARHLRALFHNSIILIALTAHGSDEDRQNCFDAGFDRHVTKPADPIDLQKLLLELAQSISAGLSINLPDFVH